MQKSALGAGHFNPEIDDDGITRRVPMLAEYNGAYYEPLSLAIVRLLLGSPKVLPGYPADRIWTKKYSGLEWIEVGPLKIPVDEHVTALVPYRGRQGSFKYISAVDVLNDRVEPGGQIRAAITNMKRFLRQLLLYNLSRRHTLEWRYSGQQFVDHHPEAVYIALRCCGSEQDLFRGGVARREDLKIET